METGENRTAVQVRKIRERAVDVAGEMVLSARMNEVKNGLREHLFNIGKSCQFKTDGALGGLSP